jgi:hypothetical protein
MLVFAVAGPCEHMRVHAHLQAHIYRTRGNCLCKPLHIHMDIHNDLLHIMYVHAYKHTKSGMMHAMLIARRNDRQTDRKTDILHTCYMFYMHVTLS